MKYSHLYDISFVTARFHGQIFVRCSIGVTLAT